MKKIRMIMSAVLTVAVLLSAMPLVFAEGIGYSATLSVDRATASKGDTVKAAVGVTSEGGYGVASAEIVIGYDEDVLEFNAEESVLPAYCSVTDENGEVSIISFGEEVSDNVAFVFAFTVIASDTETKLTLKNAAFSDAKTAVSSDLIKASVAVGEVKVTVNPESYPVTIDETLFKGPSSVKKGGNYVFTLADDGQFYDYGTISAKVNGISVTVKNNGNGSYTVENVNGALEITATRTPKSYSVTVSGETESAPSTASYGTDYTFKLKPNVPAGDSDGVNYSIKSIKIGGAVYTGYSYNATTRTCKIPGSAVKGNIEIVIEKVTVPVEKVSVSVEGAAGVAQGQYPVTVNKGTSHTLVIDPIPGYVYTVTAEMGGGTVKVKKDGNRYTVNNITDDLTFRITASVPTGSLKAYEYLQLDGKMVFLVVNETEKLDGYAYAYEGNKMYWSDTHGAYCYVVISDAMELELGSLDIVLGNAVVLSGGADVDMSGEVNQNDATLVYGMYNASFSELSSSITVAKLILADVNGDKTVNVLDSAAILK